jgi:hypothetical protein
MHGAQHQSAPGHQGDWHNCPKGEAHDSIPPYTLFVDLSDCGVFPQLPNLSCSVLLLNGIYTPTTISYNAATRTKCHRGARPRGVQREVRHGLGICRLAVLDRSATHCSNADARKLLEPFDQWHVLVTKRAEEGRSSTIEVASVVLRNSSRASWSRAEAMGAKKSGTSRARSASSPGVVRQTRRIWSPTCRRSSSS